MRDNWDKYLPSEGMKAKINKNVTFLFLAWTAETRSTIKVLFFIFRIGPGVGVGFGAGVDQQHGVGAGVEVGTAPPRLRTSAVDNVMIMIMSFWPRHMSD